MSKDNSRRGVLQYTPTILIDFTVRIIFQNEDKKPHNSKIPFSPLCPPPDGIKGSTVKMIHHFMLALFKTFVFL